MSGTVQVLYVDARTGAASEVAETLEREVGVLSVSTRATAAEALAAVEERAPDCLVTAYDLPDGDGLTLLERVRTETSGVPGILFTDNDSEAVAREALSTDETDFLRDTGPLQRLALARRIEDLVTRRRTEAGLRRQEAHYRALTEAASDVIVTIDEASEITSVNRAVEDVLGYDPDELVGTQLTRLMSEDLAERHLGAVRRYLATGERTLDWEYVELPGQHSDGHEVPLGVSFGEFEHDGEHHFTGIMRDISGRKRVEDSLRRERNLKDRLVETSPVGIVVFDAGGEPTFANERAEQLLGTADEGGAERAGDDGDERGYDWDALSFEVVDREGTSIPESDLPFRRVMETGEPVYDVELGISPRDDERTWLSVNCAPLRWSAGDDEEDGAAVTEGDGNGADVTEVILAFTDITERVELAAEREETLERVTDAFFALDEEWNFTYLNDRAHELINPEDEELVGTNIWEEFSEAIGSTFEEQYRHAMDVQETVSFEAFYPDPLDAWFEVTAYPSETGLSVYFRDVTERKRREEQLASLNEVSQRLADCETDAEVSEVAVESARDTLGLTTTEIQLYDEESGRLGTAARTPELTDLVGDGPLFGPDRGLPWTVFAEQEAAVHGDLLAETDVSDADTPLRSAIVLPLGEYGVFVAGETTTDAFPEADRNLAKVLVGNVVSALDRADRERILRERKNTLEAQNETLERVRRINEIIRGITGDLIQATTREEALDAVCTRLASADQYRFAWIGTYDGSTDELSPEASVGVEDGYLTEILATDGDLSSDEPTVQAARTLETQVRNGLSATPPFDPWQRAALERDYRSAIAVPLVYRGTLYGVLGLYADRTDVFTDTEASVFTELGETISYALNALERRQALLSEESVELEFRIRDATDPVLQFVEETDSEFAFETVVPGEGGQLRVFFTMAGVTPERVVEFGEATFPQGITHVSEREDESLFRCSLPPSTFVSTLVNRGAMPRTITATGDEARFVIRIPRSAEIRTYVELFESKYDEVTLISRRGVDEPTRTRRDLKSEFESRLTERQREVLETASLSGFFEWPRETTAQELAEMFDVSQPTVSRHIRGGERTLFDMLFDDE